MKSIWRSVSLSWISLFVCLLLHFSSALPQARLSAEPHTPPHGDGAANKTVAPASRRSASKTINLPLFFEANKGQTDSSVKFLTRSKGYMLFLTPTETVFAGAKMQVKEGSNGFATLPDSKVTAQAVVRMQLAGANSAPLMNGLEELPGKVNYLIGNDPTRWQTGVPLYSQVRAEQVYPGVDLLFHGDQKQLEYDFIVAPGADPSKIAFRICGAARMEIDARGDLVLHTADSDFRMHKPVIYQTIASERHAIEGGFVRKGKREVAFRLGAYDRSQPLVIDPAIGYSTFLGGEGVDELFDLAVDNSTPASPKLYVAGLAANVTISTFPETSTFIGPTGGTTSGFTAEIDPGATSSASLKYLTFIGGSTAFTGTAACDTLLQKISLDASRGASSVEAVVGGLTNCSDYPATVIPTTPPGPIAGNSAAVVTRLNAAGTATDASALLGGNGEDHNGAYVSVDSSGNVLMTGATSSTNYPVISGAYIGSLNNSSGSGSSDCYIAKLQRSNLMPTYFSYLNVGGGTTASGGFGSGVGIGCGAVEDSTGKFDVGGSTLSSAAFNVGASGANLANGFQTTVPTSATKATFVMQLDPTASGIAELKYASYFAGGGATSPTSGAVDLGNGVAAVGGFTTSETTGANAPDIPLKNAYQNTNLAAGTTGGQTGYLLVLDTTQTGAASLLCSTYFGGSSGSDEVFGVGYDAGDPSAFRIILGGQTSSGPSSTTPFPTVNSLQSYVGTGGSPDAFVSVLNVPLSTQSSPASLIFSTYIGGGNASDEDDEILAVGVDANHTIYAAGRSNSPQGFFANTSPATTVNGFQPTCTSCNPTVGSPADDAVVFSIATGGTGTLQSIAVTPATASIAVGQTQQFHAVGNYSDGTEQDITNSDLITWGTSPAGIATMSTTTPGLSMAVAAGTTSVTPTPAPTPNGITVLNSGSLTVTGAAAATHFLVSAPAVATAGMQLSFTVTAQDASNNTVTGYAGTVHITSSDTAAVLPVNSTLTNGVGVFTATLNTAGSQTFTATDTVTASITGTSSAITVSAVSGPALQSIAVTPAGQTIGLGGAEQFTATGTYSSGPAQDITTSVTWASSSPTVVSISNTSGTQGLATASAVNVGSTQITASLGGVTSPGVTLTVAANGVVILTPFETYFGSAQSPIPVGTPNGPQTVTLSNQSGGAITVGGISFTGNAAADFSQSNTTCPSSSSSLANGSSCAIPVTFAPHGTGARTADVIVTLSSGTGFSQPPSSITNLAGLTSISPSTPNAPVTAYDNFTLASASSITGIQWMGFQSLAGQQCPSSPCIPAAIAQFQINFYSDASGSPGTVLANYTISGNANQTQIGTGTYSTETGLPVYSYSANLSSPFSAQGGTTYWVSIVPTQPFPPYWAWLLGTGGDGTSAQTFNGSTTLQPFDLAFSLTTGQSGQTSQTYSSHLIGNGTILQLPGFMANTLAANDDDSTGAVTLPFSINFFGTTYSQLFVNNNGNVTFGDSLSEFTPTGLTSDIGLPIIAAYWADVDTRGPGSGLLTYGVDTVNGHQAFGVDWQDVGYYDSETDKLNSFQLILIDRSDTGAGNFDIEFNYNKIQWEAGDVSGGSDGLCTDPTECAAVGYSNGSGTPGTNFQLTGSFVIGALLDTNTSTGLIYNSLPAPGTAAVPGQYVFQVRGGSVQDADLALTMSQSANPIAPGQQETYTLTVTNVGPADATSVVLSDTLPTNATLLSSTFSGGTCTGTTTLTCNLGTIAANSVGVVVTIVATVNANATGTIVNNASVTSSVPDNNPTNNSASTSAIISTTPTIVSVNPATGQQGQTGLSVAITGQNTHFAQATTAASFGAGITVASLTVSSATSATAVLNIDAAATTGARTVTMTTNTEVATLANGFTVVALGAAALSSVNPNLGLLGAQGVSVVITGQNTHFAQGSTAASFGAGITVASLTVSSATSATAVLNISATAALGPRNVSMTTGEEVATLAGGFTVTPFVVTFATAPPVTPPNVPPGGSLAVGLILTGGPNFSGTVTLTCSDPTDNTVTCSIQPGSVTLTGNGTTEVAIVVSTFCTANVPALGPIPGGMGGGLGMLLLTLLLGSGVWTNRRRPRWAMSFAMLMLVVFAGAACNSLPKSPTGAVTQPGLKNIVVSAQNGGNVQHIPIQFNVE
jgi:uncharacterized repeat protein (TIGR01451 family)